MKKKVIFLIGTLSSGGAERVVSNLSMKLPDDIEKEIILFGDKATIDYPYNGKVTFLDKAPSKGLINKLITFIRRVNTIKRIKRNNPDVPFISFLEYPNLLNMLSPNRDSIVSVRNFMSTKHGKGIKSILWNVSIKLFYKKAHKIIVVSKQIKDDLIKNYKIPEEKIKVIYNFYLIDELGNQSETELEEKERLIFDKPTIINVGRLSKQKGQHHLINAFDKVRESIPNAQLVFLGQGGLEEELTKQASKLGLSDSVHFLGFQKNPFKYISKSKVFVLSSYYEGFPNALAEAMACGVPVISTDCPSGPREILAPQEYGNQINYGLNKSRYGVLVPDFTTSDEKITENIISESIIEIMNNTNLYNYFLEQSHQRIQDFNVENIVKEWEKLIAKNC